VAAFGPIADIDSLAIKGQLRAPISPVQTPCQCPKAAIELSAIKLKDESNASLKLPKGGSRKTSL